MYRITIDAGHGLHTPGRRCMKQHDPAETREWQLNSRIADRVEPLLTSYENVTVRRADDRTGAADIPLAARVAQANVWKADLYISIHHNAGGGTGIMSFCYAQGSAKSFGFRDLVYARLIDATGNRGNRAEPLTTANFYVVKNTTMPAVLLELGFMDHPADIRQIITGDYADKCAQGIVAAVAEYAGLQSIDKPEPAVSGWVRESDGRWWYRNPDGSYPADCWRLIGGRFYYFDAAGYMQTGHVVIGGEEFWLCDRPGHDEGACMITDNRGVLRVWEVE